MTPQDLLLALAGGQADIGAVRRARLARLAAPMEQAGQQASQYVSRGVSGVSDYLGKLEEEKRKIAAQKERDIAEAKGRVDLMQQQQTAELSRQRALAGDTRAEDARRLAEADAKKKQADELTGFARQQAELGTNPEEAYKAGTPGRVEVSPEQWQPGGLPGKTNTQDVANAVREQAKLIGEEKMKRDLTASQIAENEAQAKRAARGPSADPLAQELKQGRIDAAKDAAAKRARENTAGHLAPRALAERQVKLGSVGDALDELSSVENMIKEHPEIASYTGPLDKLKTWLSDKTGMTPTAAAEIQATLLQNLQVYRNRITGAAFSKAEDEDIRRVQPSMSDNLPALMGKLSANRKILERKHHNLSLIVDQENIHAADEERGIKPSTEAAKPSGPSSDAMAIMRSLRAKYPNETVEQRIAREKRGEK